MKQVEILREQYARNGVEAVQTREQEVGKPLPTTQQQETAKTKEPEQAAQQQPKQEQEERIHEQPDRELMSAADRLQAQSHLPSEGQINMSPRADTDIDVPIHSIGSEEVPAEVLQQTNSMRTAAQDTGFVSAKNTYIGKAQKLSKPNQKKLAFYERGVMDSIRGLTGDTRTQALRNYYEHTAKHMHGTKLDLPQPIQIPTQTHSQTVTLIKQEAMQPSQTMGYDSGEPEISR
ncbi:hypothetical protein [Neisseria iguanae]|uniref:Uncharacterized protein n=1 Tax=Neisseria iguanae TaxID=90242 RepID=A0A2P7U0Z5_9NEIS|nr:hypothetical protein [Neisseria iguanae]PSJ80652.1 hypothetical protein C7N83_05060 [Neisseria iguanae]